MKFAIIYRIIVLSVLVYISQSHKSVTKSIEEMAIDYEDDKNSMIAITERDNSYLYEDFYDELDNRIVVEQSMNIIFFGTPSAFMRMDAESVLHLFINTKKHLIPISRTLIAWDIVTDGKTAALLQGREYLAFDTLLNVVPEEDLYYVNFGDPSVMKYFSNHLLKLHKRKSPEESIWKVSLKSPSYSLPKELCWFGVLIAAYRRYYGNDWYKNSTYINELGYLLCGFSSSDLQQISPETFKELNIDVLGKLVLCDVNQTKTLYNIATDPDAYGKPYKWSSHEVGRLNSLFACIPKEDISSIQLEAIAAISPEVIKTINQAKLEFFTKQQIHRMNRNTRHMYVLRIQLRDSLDMSQIAKSMSHLLPCPTAVLIFMVTPIFM